LQQVAQLWKKVAKLILRGGLPTISLSFTHGLSRVKSDGRCDFFNRFNGFLVPAPE